MLLINRNALNYIRSKGAPDLFAGFDLSERQEALGTLEGLSSNFSETVYGEALE